MLLKSVGYVLENKNKDVTEQISDTSNKNKISHLNRIWNRQIIEDGYIVIPNELLLYREELNITSNELLVILAILKFCWYTREAWPSQSKIGQLVGLNRKTVNTHIASLCKKGLIKKQKRFKQSNSYNIRPLVKALDECRTRKIISYQEKKYPTSKSSIVTEIRLREQDKSYVGHREEVVVIREL